MASTPVGNRFVRLRAWAFRVEWSRPAAVFALVTIGFSEIFYSLILGNAGRFPLRASFHLWVVFWVGLLPFALLAGVDVLLSRTGTERAPFRVWRALLYAGAIVSFLRQVQVGYPAWVSPWLGASTGWIVGSAVLLLAFLLGLRAGPALGRYFALLGILALMLTGHSAAGVGLFGRAWGGDGGAASAERWGGPPVFVLVFDELAYEVLMKDGAPDAEAYPHFAALAAESAWFSDATTNHSWTEDAIPTLLSGRLSPGEGSATFFDFLPPGCDVIFKGSESAGERWVEAHPPKGRAVVGSRNTIVGHHPLRVPVHLSAALAESGFARASTYESLELKLPPPRAWGGLSGHGWVVEEIQAFLGGIRREEASGRLIYWHCSLPHAPFVFDRDGTLHGAKETMFAPVKPGFVSHDPQKVLANYRRQVGFVDRVIGDFVAALRREGLYESAVVAVTSDHGLRTWWGDLEPPGHPRVLSGLTPRVPLLLRAPGLKPGRRDTDYQHVDFAPTLLDLLGCRYDPAAFEGVSAFASARHARSKVMRNARAGLTYERDAKDGLWRVVEPR